jgi:hypothetical protein
MWYSNILRKFAKRAQRTFGAVAKGNLWNLITKAKTAFFNDYKKFCFIALCFELHYLLPNKIFKYE